MSTPRPLGRTLAQMPAIELLPKIESSAARVSHDEAHATRRSAMHSEEATGPAVGPGLSVPRSDQGKGRIEPRRIPKEFPSIGLSSRKAAAAEAAVYGS
jgi:hypothetical protein